MTEGSITAGSEPAVGPESTPSAQAGTFAAAAAGSRGGGSRGAGAVAAFERPLVAGLAVVAGLVAAAARAAPTGTAWWDAVLTFAIAALVVAAAAKAPRWVVIVMAAVGAALVGLSPWALVGWAGLVAALGSALLDRRSRLLGALAAGLSVQALVRLPAIGFFGLPSLVAGIVISSVLYMGYRYSGRRARRRIRVAVAVTALIAVGLAVVGGLALMSARADVERGVDAANRGLAAARAADTATIVAELEIAEEALVSANDRIDSPLLLAARALPIAAQHHRALGIATTNGALVAREAAAAVREADIASITLSAGRVDLDALSAMQPRLAATAAALAQASYDLADLSDDWLLPLVSDRIGELRGEIDEVLPEAELAAQAAAVVPSMLGSDGTKTYFVIFGTPAEARELGGLLGSWAVIEFTDGAARLAESGRIAQLFDVARAKTDTLDGDLIPEWFLAMNRPTQWPQNLTGSPDFGVVRDVSQLVLADGPGQPVDGYVYLDTWALIDLLAITGPVDNPFGDGVLTRDSAPRFFFDEQYRLATNRNEVFAQLATLADAIVGELDTIALPGPEELGRVLGPAARAGRMQVVTFDEAANDFLHEVKLLRRFGEYDTQDFVGVVHTNGTESKLELYLERSVSYEIAAAADGTTSTLVTVGLRSPVPADAPDYVLGEGNDGEFHQVLLSVYSPQAVVETRIDGEVVPFSGIEEFGLARYLVDVAVPWSGDAVTVQYELAGRVDPAAPYDLTMWHQPLVNPDSVVISYRGPDGAFDIDAVLVENLVVGAGS